MQETKANSSFLATFKYQFSTKFFERGFFLIRFFKNLSPLRQNSQGFVGLIMNLEGEYKVAAAKPMTLQDRILQIDHIQARRFSKLSGAALEIATEGIIRHLRACARMDVNPDASAVREIIDDALNGRRVFAETSNDIRVA